MGTSLFTGVTGLLALQRRIDVIANNIANVNTPGYRGSRMLFEDMISQTLQGGRGASGDQGSSNPLQIGLGVGIASIDVNFSQGALVTTGIDTDLAIQGRGFFVLSDGESQFYTRDGSFELGTDGRLIDPSTGLRVLGYLADANGVIDVEGAPTELTLPVGGVSIVQETNQVRLIGNLNSDAAVGDTVSRTVRVYDSLGTARDIEITYTKRATVTVGADDFNAWDWEASYTNQDTPPVTSVVGSGTILFDGAGVFSDEGTVSGGAFTSRPALDPEVAIDAAALGGAAALPDLPIDFALDYTFVTELSDTSDIVIQSQDGFPRGVLENFTISRNGQIEGQFTNGLTRVLGQIGLANFSNDGGLLRFGNNLFRETSASGVAQLGAPGTGGRGEVGGGVLEQSNVDLGTEFSNLIVAQRAFQANARSLTTSDVLLQETVNLIR